ncbi:TMEM175 family protein [Asanoa sp. NPDC050611]|uniref:TMEM175 family protein n=1 Tax=Asanoa sp. NPDC050611 TaxID=3157098 RepID=UPI0033EC3780
MRTSRLEAFSDGVLAIIITIMVLELAVPEGHDLSALVHETGVGLLTYLLSFVYVGIYWNNHHHMFHLVQRINGGVLWANLALLFSLSLFPFTTAWVDESRFAQTPVVVYGLNLLAASAAYLVLQKVIISQEGPSSPLHAAIGSDVKGKVSTALYLGGVLCAVLISDSGPWIAVGCFVSAAVLWIVPDRRIDRAVREVSVGDGASR